MNFLYDVWYKLGFNVVSKQGTFCCRLFQKLSKKYQPVKHFCPHLSNIIRGTFGFSSCFKARFIPGNKLLCLVRSRIIPRIFALSGCNIYLWSKKEKKNEKCGFDPVLKTIRYSVLYAFKTLQISREARSFSFLHLHSSSLVLICRCPASLLETF